MLVRADSAEDAADRLYDTDSHLVRQGASPLDFSTFMPRDRLMDSLGEAMRRGARLAGSVLVRTRAGEVEINQPIFAPGDGGLHSLMGLSLSVCEHENISFSARDRDAAIGVLRQEFEMDEPTATALLDPAYASEDGIAEVAIGESESMPLDAGAQYEGSNGSRLLIAQPRVYVMVPKPGASGFVWHN
jgi:hypothetical protein